MRSDPAQVGPSRTMADPSSTTGKDPHAGASPHAPGQAPAKPTSDDVLSVLAEFEAGLDSLKQLYAQRQALSEELKRKSEQMNAAEADLRQRRDDLAQREREITRSIADVGDRWRHVEQREADIDRLRKELEARAAEADQRDREATAAAAKAAEAAVNASEALRRAEQRHAEADARHAELESASGELASHRKDIAAKTAELAEMASAATRELDLARAQREAVESRAKELNDQAAQVAAAREQLTTLQASLESRQDSIERERADLRAATAEFEQKVREHQQGTANAESLRALADQLSRQLQEAQDALAEQAGLLEKARADHEAREREAKGRESDLQRRLDKAIREHEQAAPAVSDGKTRQDDLRRELDQARLELQLAVENYDTQSRRRNAEMETLARALACSREVIEEYESLWKHEIAEHLRTRLDAQSELTRARQAAAEGGAADHDPQSEALAERLRKACEAIVQLRDEREEILARSRAIEGQLAETKKEIQDLRSRGSGRAAHPAAIQRRKHRLDAARRLSRARARDIKRAEDALATRFEQCERILAMRQELADARELVNAAQRSLSRQRAGGRTAALLFYGIASAALLGVLSWFGTQAAIPGEYAARAVLAADPKGRSIGPGELAEWQAFHEALVEDPRMIDVVAERMQRRGIHDMARPADVATAIRNHLSHHSAADGELSLEWRGQGSERTQRLLDTYVTAMVSQANAARERRVDGAVTTIRVAATAGNERLDVEYRWIAGLVWAGAVVVVFGVAAAIWRRLVNAKATFEGSATVDAAIDMRRWPSTPRT